METEEIARLAMRRVGAAETDLAPNHGWSNDAWIGTDVVVRLGDDRLFGSFDHEARIGPLLRDAGIPAPECVGHGTFADLGLAMPGIWIVVTRVPGKTMAAAWPTLSSSERLTIGSELGAIVRRLNQSEVTIGAPAWWIASHKKDGLHNAYHGPPSLVGDIASAVEALPGCPRPLLRGVRTFLDERCLMVADEPEVPTHCDAHGFNVMVDDGHVVALLDWEGAHCGAASTELDIVLRQWGLNFPGSPDVAPPAISVADGVEAVDAIAHGYPELFALPRLRERLEFHDAYWKLHGVLVAQFFANPISWDELEAALDGDTHLRRFEHLF